MTMGSEHLGPTVQLVGLRVADALSQFRREQERVNTEWSAIGLGRAYHIRALFELAEAAVITVLEPPISGCEEAATNLLRDLTANIRSWITNPAGRTDSPMARAALDAMDVEFSSRLSRRIQRKVLEAQLASSTRLGRTKGTGFDKADEPLLQRMREMIQTGRASSIWEAAGLCAPKAKGGGTEGSKQRRLSDKYKERFGD